jgi:hypothetical protein
LNRRGARGGKGEAWCVVRGVGLAYVNPFTRRRVKIQAPLEGFVREYGFDIPRLYREAP